MSDLENKLNEILSDPDAMAQIAKLANSLGGESGASPPQAESPAPAPASDTQSLLAQLSRLTGGLDPALMSRLLPALGEMNRPESAQTAAFLNALRPFLRPQRQEKVERAAQLAKWVHLGKVFLTGGGNHV